MREIEWYPDNAFITAFIFEAQEIGFHYNLGGVSASKEKECCYGFPHKMLALFDLK